MKLSRVVATAAITTLLPLIGAAQASAETAYPAAAFKDSVGVNTKLAAPQTAYYNRTFWDRQNANEAGVSAAENVKKVLERLGVKHIRYDFCKPQLKNCARGNATAKMLHDQLGIRTLDDYFGSSAEAVDRFGSPAGIDQEIDENLALAGQYTNADGTGPIEALEGPNEFDRHSGKYADWAARLSHTQAQAQAKITGGPLASKLAQLTFLPSPLGVPNTNLASSKQLVGWAGNATFKRWDKAPLDAANQHFYSYFDCPETAIQGGVTSGTCNTISMPKVQCPAVANPIWLNCANLIAGADKPVWVTEAGYTTSIDSLEGVGSNVAAAYLPRLLLDAWRQQAVPGRRHWARTYLYELIDSRDGRYCGMNCNADREAGHGLASTNYKLKGQGRALERMMKILDDPGAPVTGEGVPANITVTPDDPTQVRKVLFRKSNGQHVLAIWKPVKLWRNATRNWWGGIDRGRSLPEGDLVQMTITLPTAMPIKVDRPSIDNNIATSRGPATSHVVAARGDVTLVTIG